MVTVLSTYYEAEYYTEYEDIIPTQFASAFLISSPFRSGGFGWGRGAKTSQGNFQMNDGNGYGDGAYIFYMSGFVCRRFNFWEIEITSK